MNNKGFEFSFGWLFAIIVGAAVLFLAIYASTKFISTEQTITNTEAGQSVGAILSPFETSLESSTVNVVSTGVPTRIYFNCSNANTGGQTGKTFGKQLIQVSVSSGLGVKWPEPGIANVFYNKYVFAQNMTEDSKKFYVLSVPFNYPYKVADLQIVFSDKQNYCFINAPQDVKNTLNSTYIPTVQLVSSSSECRSGSKRVCFVSSGCDIDVTLNSNSVKKNGQTLYYESPELEGNALMYGAIFADTKTYECQVQRLGKRISILGQVYQDKNSLISGAGCGSNLITELAALQSGAETITSSIDLRPLGSKAKEVRDKNEVQTCKLF